MSQPLSARASAGAKPPALSELPLFGHDLITPGQIAPEAGAKLVSPRYLLGPGDVVAIDVWGEFAISLRLEVSDDGFLVFSDSSRLRVGGLRFADLGAAVLRQLRRTHARALSDAKLASGEVHVQVVLDQIRGTRVFVGGEVAEPGYYTLQEVSASLLLALGRAGGIKESGSLRAIRIDRAGKQRTVDLYGFLLRGGTDVSHLFLEEEDVVYVPLPLITAGIGGAVRRPARYELLPGETLGDLLRFAGGPSATADLSSVKIYRFTANQGRQVIDADLAATNSASARMTLRDGDLVTVATAPRRLGRPVVTLQGGGILQPGQHELRRGETLGDVLARAKGLYEDAIRDRVEIRRLDPATQTRHLLLMRLHEASKMPLSPEDQVTIYSRREIFGGDGQVELAGFVKVPGPQPLAAGTTLADLLYRAGGLADADHRKRTDLEHGSITRIDTVTGRSRMVWFDVNAVLEGRADLSLQSDDVVRLYPAERYRDHFRAQISGAVRDPGSYPLYESLRLSDLLALAGGLSQFADSSQVEVVQTYQEPPAIVTVDAAREADTYVLSPGDEVFVRRLPEARGRGSVSVTGLVTYPGDYALTHANQSLAEIVTAAGGLTEDAYPGGIQYYRGPPGDRRRVAVDAARALRGDGRYNIILSPGDSIAVSGKDWSVRVTGAVVQPLTLQYVAGWRASDYVSHAGGWAADAARARAYLIRPNGFVVSCHRRLWRDPAVPPGSTIVVPTLQAKRSQSWYRRWHLAPAALAAGLAIGIGL